MTVWMFVLVGAVLVVSIVLRLVSRNTRGRHVERLEDRPARLRPGTDLPTAHVQTEPGVERQCPNCGSHALGGDPPQYVCRVCRHQWSNRLGEAWPDTVVRPWLWAVSSSENNKFNERNK